MEHSGYYTADDGTDIWYGTSGEGPALVLCDGLACDGFIWPYLFDYLVENYRIVRWHYAGHGRSDTPEDLTTLTVERFAEDLAGVLRELQIDSAVLAGHSLGVQVLFEFYDRYPGQVDGLVPICGSYKEPLDTFHNNDTLRRALPYLRTVVDAAPAAAQTVWRHAVPSTFSKLVASLAETNPRLMRAKDIEPYLEHVAEMDVDAFLTMLENIADHSAEAVLETIDVPTLVVAGEEDTFTPLFRSEEMADRIATGELVVVAGGTHAAPLEAPDLVNSEVERLLRQLYGGSS